MKNHKERDMLFINKISAPNNIKSISKVPVGKASKDAFWVYAGKRHAVGSIITKEDGSKLICTEDGSWQNI